jgi:hypothetical protein
MLFDMHPTPFTCLLLNYIDLSILNDLGLKTLGVLDVDGLDVGVELLLGALLVVTLTGDANTEAERNALDTRLPDLLVKLGVEADIVGALNTTLACLMKHRPQHRKSCMKRQMQKYSRTIAFVAKARISLIALGALFLKLTP